ncbi:MAG: rhomboid family intramembrane serine protease [Lachnospiraceae bacterium]|nr:rhomboid family intramembrane serine protease [Lachnospiraceae bacterium]
MSSFNEKNRLRISFNSPVILGFVIICFMALILGNATLGASTNAVFSAYRSSLLNPLTYVRFVSHVFGHADWDHFLGNIMIILIVGPLLEEKYGSSNILFVMLFTAIATGLVNFIFFPHTQLLGASGIVFSLILLSSFTSITEGEIPLTFIIVTVVYIGQQIYEGVFIRDNISNITHIIGGLVGAGLGYIMNKEKIGRIRG